MMNRKEDQGDRAIEDIKNECKEKGLPAPDISWRGVDLGDFEETKKVFSALASEEARLDILVLSSGINANTFRLVYFCLSVYRTSSHTVLSFLQTCCFRCRRSHVRQCLRSLPSYQPALPIDEEDKQDRQRSCSSNCL